MKIQELTTALLLCFINRLYRENPSVNSQSGVGAGSNKGNVSNVVEVVPSNAVVNATTKKLSKADAHNSSNISNGNRSLATAASTASTTGSGGSSNRNYNTTTKKKKLSKRRSSTGDFNRRASISTSSNANINTRELNTNGIAGGSNGLPSYSSFLNGVSNPNTNTGGGAVQDNSFHSIIGLNTSLIPNALDRLTNNNSNSGDNNNSYQYTKYNIPVRHPTELLNFSLNSSVGTGAGPTASNVSLSSNTTNNNNGGSSNNMSYNVGAVLGIDPLNTQSRFAQPTSNNVGTSANNTGRPPRPQSRSINSGTAQASAAPLDYAAMLLQQKHSLEMQLHQQHACEDKHSQKRSAYIRRIRSTSANATAPVAPATKKKHTGSAGNNSNSAVSSGKPPIASRPLSSRSATTATKTTTTTRSASPNTGRMPLRSTPASPVSTFGQSRRNL